MQVRSATTKDKPAIIELLKKSLGESTIPKSEYLWTWKHELNPFGPSYVLVAEEANVLIGLRAFMQWHWQWKGKTYRAIRAVDTATHPEFQGKGIFKKLTLQQAELCRQQGVDFIFNTPNTQSMPGYLKMGWLNQGNIPLKFKVLKPFTLAYSLFFNRDKYQNQTTDPSPQQEWNDDLFSTIGNPDKKTELLTTIISKEYILWRYANNPLFRYNYFSDNKNYILVSRIKTQSFRKELRLVDFILLDTKSDARQISQHMKKEVFSFCKEHHVDLISSSGQQYLAYKSFFGWLGILPIRSLGPGLTLKDLNMNDRFQSLLDVNNWGYSLGDLELF